MVNRRVNRLEASQMGVKGRRNGSVKSALQDQKRLCLIGLIRELLFVQVKRFISRCPCSKPTTLNVLNQTKPLI